MGRADWERDAAKKKSVEAAAICSCAIKQLTENLDVGDVLEVPQVEVLPMGKLQPLATSIANFRQARAMLPLVRSIVADAQVLERQIEQRRHDLNRVQAAGQRKAGKLYEDELAESRSDLEADERQLTAYREELSQLGIRLVSSGEGEVEFPLSYDDRLIYLCWKMGDEDLLYWRQPEQTFDLRVRIPSDELTTLANASAF
jgi:hypothetical protein